jgi:hypothetical protein
MSVIEETGSQGDTAKFRQALIDRADEFAKIADTARAEIKPRILPACRCLPALPASDGRPASAHPYR